MEAVKQAACDAIDARASELHELSQEIWSHPEENFQEVHAHGALTSFLEKQGLQVEPHFVVDTGFRGVFGSQADGGPHVAVLCEYDALPEIGHGCGHNLIAEAGVAAGLGVKAAFEAAGKPLGKLTVLGTPAEEGGGGKLDMIEADFFKDVDVAMMAHPIPFDTSEFLTLAIERATITYHGKAAHASAFPWQGVNALDAAVLCYQNVSCFRQQMRPDWRVHGIISNGGAKPNIIPEKTALEFYARTPTIAELQALKKSLVNCFESAATATGCTVEIDWVGRPYWDMLNIEAFFNLYTNNAKMVGVDFEAHQAPKELKNTPAGSTDMGNVSYVVPSIHPGFYIGTLAANHTREFTQAGGDVKAQPYTLTVGKALACTAIDIFSQPDTLRAIKEEFKIKTTNASS